MPKCTTISSTIDRHTVLFLNEWKENKKIQQFEIVVEIKNENWFLFCLKQFEIVIKRHFFLKKKKRKEETKCLTKLVVFSMGSMFSGQ